MSYKIMLLSGDGIGPEIMSEAKKIIIAAGEKFGFNFEFAEGLIGGCSYEEYGEPLTEDTIEKCKECSAVLLGAVGGPKWENLPHLLKPEAALLKLRKELDLWANLRPAKVYDELVDASSLKNEIVKGTDFLVLRELTGGIYYGQSRGFDSNRGWNTMEYKKDEVERIVREAFEIARKRNKKVTSVDKANVLEVSQFWRSITIEMHKNYQDVELNHMYVDNAAMQIVRNPKQFDVIVTSNLFGDILSDLAGSMSGSLGMLPSASIGHRYALYEPIHGSAPDIAGKNVANPIAMLSSVAMMFNHSFGFSRISTLIDNAIKEILSEGYATRDIFSPSCKLVSTTEMGDLILERFERINDEVLVQI